MLRASLWSQIPLPTLPSGEVMIPEEEQRGRQTVTLIKSQMIVVSYSTHGQNRGKLTTLVRQLKAVRRASRGPDVGQGGLLSSSLLANPQRRISRRYQILRTFKPIIRPSSYRIVEKEKAAGLVFSVRSNGIREAGVAVVEARKIQRLQRQCLNIDHQLNRTKRLLRM